MVEEILTAEESGPEEAGHENAAAGGQITEMPASQRPTRHVGYAFRSEDILDVKLYCPVVERDYLNLLKRHDRVPAEILSYFINSSGLEEYLTDGVTRAMIRGDRNYNTLDILAVGNDENTKRFVYLIELLYDAGGGEHRLSLIKSLTEQHSKKYSRDFEIKSPQDSIGVVLSADAVGNYVLKAKPAFGHFSSSPIRLCVLTNEAYRRIQNPAE
jgi:hypothetical protein